MSKYALKEGKIIKIDENVDNYEIEDFKEDDLIHFRDGMVWIVVKTGMRKSYDRKRNDEVTVKPYNDLAKERNVSIPQDFSIDFINKNIVKKSKI